MATRSYTPVSETATQADVIIYATSTRRPSFVDEPGIFKVGEVTLDLDMTKPTVEERRFRVEMSFGGTEVTVRVLNDASGEQIREAVFEYMACTLANCWWLALFGVEIKF